jgi:hypothetical protein
MALYGRGWQDVGRQVSAYYRPVFIRSTKYRYCTILAQDADANRTTQTAMPLDVGVYARTYEHMR